MDDQHLERRTALPIERERSQQAFLDGQFDVRIGKDDRGVLGVQSEDGAKPMRFRVLLLEVVGNFAGSDQCQDIDFA